jgi:hypothetical protein
MTKCIPLFVITLSYHMTGTTCEPTNSHAFSLPSSSMFQSIVDYAVLQYPSTVIILRYFAFFLPILKMQCIHMSAARLLIRL